MIVNCHLIQSLLTLLTTIIRYYNLKTFWEKILVYKVQVNKKMRSAWGRYWLWPQLAGCEDLHQTEENHKFPKEKTTMGFGEIIYSKTKSAGYSRRETRCNWLWQWERWSAVEQYKGMFLRYCQWSGRESREESKKTMDYTGNDQ